MRKLEDIDISDSVALREAEQEQLKWVEDKGLKLLIDHTHHDPSVGINMVELYDYARGKNISVVTTAGLVSLETWNNTKKEDRDNIDVVASGIALCSAKDQFNKRIGRVVATARAINQHQSQ